MEQDDWICSDEADTIHLGVAAWGYSLITSQTSLKCIIHYDIFSGMSVADDDYAAGLDDR